MNHCTSWSSADAGGLCWVSDPSEAYLEATVDAVGAGVLDATTSDGRKFKIDLKAALAPPTRGPKAKKDAEAPRRVLQRVPPAGLTGW